MRAAKVKALSDLTAPSSEKEIPIFVGLAKFYRRFVKRYAKTANPLADLTCDSEPDIFDKLPVNAISAFEDLKDVFDQLSSTGFATNERLIYCGY